MALLREALRGLLHDGIPQSSSHLVTTSRKAAEELLDWTAAEANADRSESFTSEVVQLLDKAFPPTQLGRMQAAREKMWGAYHAIRTSQEFKCLWKTFLQESRVQATPIIYQSLTDRLFQKRIELHFPIPSPSRPRDSEVETSTLTFEEENAIRYAAGYVFRAVKKKIIKSSFDLKEQLVEIVDMLLQNDDDVGEQDASCEWMAIVDRGGLVHISDDLYRVFVAIELHIRKFFNVENAREMTPTSKGKVVSSLLSNEDVLFFWCMVCCDVPEEFAKELLKRIVELWTTIRGFSFAKSYMEIYKQKTKKILQRSKALRKDLFSGSV